MLTVRSYQTEAVNSIYHYFQKNTGNPVIAMPTGTGKSVVIALFLESALRSYPNQRIMVLTHVKELIQQNYSKLLEVWPFAPAGIYSSGLNRKDLHAPITFAGIASVAKKWIMFGHIDLVIIDEAHLLSPDDTTMYQVFLAGLKSINPYLKVIGTTATPWRLGHGKIIDPSKNKKGEEIPPLFTDICFDITGVEPFNRLIAEGYLAPLIPKKTGLMLNTDGVHMRGGEFIEAELQRAVDKEEITRAAIREAMEHGYNRNHWLVFTAGVNHAIHTADIMNEYGIPTIAIHSKMTETERDNAIKGFKSGKYRAATNNNILTTGFDFPAIDLILGLRPTASAVLWVQMLGRGTRPSLPTQKENCLVLDFANNTRRLGPINDPLVPRRKGEKPGTAMVKECPVCSSLVHLSVRKCPGIMKDGSPCDHEFTFETKLKQTASTMEIIKGDMPVVEVFKVDHITYSEHRKEGVPLMMKVCYYHKLKIFPEFVCIEHQNYAGKKAREWWRARSEDPIPQTTWDAIESSSKLKVPTHIRVWTNKKYPEILAFCYDGTAFGKEEPSTDLPTVQTMSNRNSERSVMEKEGELIHSSQWDDDIPF